jgi:hypothetical protein
MIIHEKDMVCGVPCSLRQDEVINSSLVAQVYFGLHVVP